MEVVENDNYNDDSDPSVPTELLELHMDLEDIGLTPEEFKEVFTE